VQTSSLVSARDRFLKPAVALVILRTYIGVIFLWAGIDKFANQAFLDPDSPNGIKADLAAAVENSPIGFLVELVDSYPVALGTAIALTEIFIGIGLIVGLWSRIWALLGILGQISIALTVGWGIDPGYESPNVPYIFALLPILAMGSGACSLDARRASAGSATAALDSGDTTSADTTSPANPARRTVMGQGAVAAGLIAVGGAIAGLGRVVGKAATDNAPSGPVEGALTTVEALKTEKVVAFTDPSTNEPGVIALDSAGNAVAFSAVCTHSGCTVRFDSEVDQLKCRCHGSKFEPDTGAIINGPAKRPLPSIAVQTSADGSITLA
jgi:thiosulfate dehydrogenase [quinone] large subunit